MKQHGSALLLAVRGTINQLLGLLGVMLAAETALFYGAFRRASANQISGAISLEELFTQSRIAWVCGGAFLLLCAVCCLQGSELRGGKVWYTLRRLSVREGTVAAWWSLCYTACFLIFWAAQLLFALLACRYYVHAAEPTFVGEQTVFLAFARSRYLHALLPLDEPTRYIRNLAFALSQGVTCSAWSYRQRQGAWGAAAVVLAALVTVTFAWPIGSWGVDVLLTLAALGIAGASVYFIWEVERDAQRNA